MHQNIGLKRFAFELPVLFSLLVIVLAAFTTEIPFDHLTVRWFDDPAPELVKVFLGHALTGLLLLWLLRKLDMLDTAGFTPLHEWRSLWLLWPFLLLITMNYDSILSGAYVLDAERPGLVALLVLLNLTLGFCEELLGRSLVLMLFVRLWGEDRHGIYKAVLVSSVLFGIAHLGNGFTGHLPWPNILTQCVYSLFFGVLFSACFLRTNAVIPLMLAHALVDFGPSVRHIAVNAIELVPPPMTWESSLISLAITTPALVYGLIILWKIKPSREL